MNKHTYISTAQKFSGVLPENYEAFIEDIAPRGDKQEKLKRLLESLIEDFTRGDYEERKEKPRVLLVYGAEGRGKTYLCSGALNEYIYRCYCREYTKDCPDEERLNKKARYITHYELDLEDKSCMNPKATKTQIEQFRYITSIPFLVIDEVGRGSWSDYSAQNIENIISKRYGNLLPTVLITNKTGKEITEMFDISIRDRLSNGKTGIALNMDTPEGKSER